MRYVIHCLLDGPVVEYHRGLVQAVADRFGLGFTRDQGLPSHFTLKYEFETEDVAPVERAVFRDRLTHARCVQTEIWKGLQECVQIRDRKESRPGQLALFSSRRSISLPSTLTWRSSRRGPSIVTSVSPCFSL